MLGLRMKKMKILKIIFSTVTLILMLNSCSSSSSQVYSGGNYSTLNNYSKYPSNRGMRNSAAIQRSTMRSYTVFGIRYYPRIESMGAKFYGIASWYGPNFHAKKTSNGETYNMYALTAAHKTFPMNTMVKVDNLDNGRSVLVRINDRGPFVGKRIIDLSNKAARTIDMVKKGTANVKLTVIGYNGKLNTAYKKNIKFNNYAKKIKKPSKKIEQVKLEKFAPVVFEETIKSISSTANSIDKGSVKEKSNIDKRDTKIKKSININRYSLQVGAFSLEDGAIKTTLKYKRKFPNKRIRIKKNLSNGKTIYKVLIEEFSSKEKAENFKLAYNLVAIPVKK